MRVHVIRAGTCLLHPSLVDGRGPRGMRALRALATRATPVAVPANVFVIEHPDGLIVIDTGIGHASARSFTSAVTLVAAAADEIGPRMRHAGLRPEDVRLVIPTHLHVDHAGGFGHFPDAEILVHRREFAYARSVLGRFACRPRIWPESFDPNLYDLESEAYGPFPETLRITDDGNVIAVGLPGHTPGQVGVILRSPGRSVFFCGDHALDESALLGHADGRRPRFVSYTSWRQWSVTHARVLEFLGSAPTTLAPAHDAGVESRLTARFAKEGGR